MAEFKLGRIRFVWKDSWAATTTYYKDDVIRFGGKVYICVLGHTSAADFFTDLEIVPSKWNLVSDGQTWKGTWTVATPYVYGDIVQYGARLYIANTVHTSAATTDLGLEADQSKWDLYSEGLSWTGDWAVDTRYIVNDVVKYGGSTYVCNTYHTSAATEVNGLELDQSKWDILNQGIEFKSTWGSATRYKINDIVQYGAALWIATTAHTSSTLFSTDVANWTQFVKGFQFESNWVALQVYQPGDIVNYGGNQYIALTNHSESNPYTETTDWQLYSQGLKFLGEWGADSTLQDYRVGEVVSHGAYTYICIQDNQNQEPPNATYWNQLNSGLRWRSEWIDDAEYLIGDIARYSDNSYICINQHISEGDDFSTETKVGAGGGAENSRPDLDITGTYWNIIAVGNEASVLTTKGDLVYYAGAGPARLPVGAEGQVLRVSTDFIPEWAYLGVSDDVYYVATHGADVIAPTNGRTIDKPWKSIRYACEQVERGAKNPNARRLLELNRQFIQREIVEWTDAQIVGNVSPFTTAFEYVSAKCERDMGYIVDALIWDVTHGGNVRTREAALSYVNETLGSPYLTQKTQTVASINYGLTVIQAVLNQLAPTINYQTTNGDNSTAVVVQYFESGLVTESVYTEITGLVGIITAAITAGVTTNIPGRLIRNTLIKVATGSYQEVLPIIVPEECCVIGDELRSTKVAARRATGTVANKISRNNYTYQLNGNLTPKADTQYSIKAYKHVESIIGDIVEGVTVTPSTGNVAVQSITYPLANADKGHERAAVTQLARMVRRNIDYSIGEKEEAVATLPLAAAMSTPAAGYARDLLIVNKDFIKSEIIGWIQDEANYPTLNYSRTKCRQDTGFIVDAVAYDLTYGGNWQTVIAAEAYFVGAVQDAPAASERAATIAAYGYLKGIMQTIARNIVVTPTYGIELQVSATYVGGATQATTVGNLLDDIIDIVTNGSGSVAIVYPSISGASAGLQSDHADLASAYSTIQDSVIDFINTNFGDFKYKGDYCRRDSGYLVDAAYYDAAFGTNFNAVTNGLSYLRPQAGLVLSQQVAQELAAINYIKGQVATSLTTDATAASRANAAYVEITDIIINGVGSADALVYTSTGVSDDTVSRQEIVNNRPYIISEITTWINAQISGNISPFTTGYTYDVALCERDIGYTLDAMAYDVQYGSNTATRTVARSLFNNITGVSVYPAGQKAPSAATYTQLGVVLAQIVRGTYAGQNTSAGDGGATNATKMSTLTGNIESVITADTLSGLVAETLPSISWVAAGIQTALGTLASDKTTIVKGTLQYLTDNYSGFVYNHAKCSRDIGYILDAARYDFCLGTNYASMIAAYSYLRRPTLKVIGDQKAATIAANEYARTLARTEVAEATAIAQVDATMQLVNDMIFGANSEGSNRGAEDFDVYSAVRQLELNRDFIVSEVSAWMDYNYVNFNNHYNSATCARDIGLIVDAVSYDLITGSNFASSVAGAAYYRIQSALVLTAQLTQTIAAVKEARQLTIAVSDSSLYVDIAASYANILNILENGLTAVPAYAFPDNGTSVAADSTTAATFIANRATYISSISSYLNTNYNAQWTALGAGGQATCQRDVGYIVDAATFDVLYGGNYQSVIAGDSYYSFGTLQIGAGAEKTATLAALTELKSLLSADAEAASQAAVESNADDVIAIVTNGAGTVAKVYPIATGETGTIQSTFTAIQTENITIQTSVTTFITNTFSSFTYNIALCKRDVGALIDAMKWDLVYAQQYVREYTNGVTVILPSNYKSKFCARYYINSVLGSQEEDFYYLRNGTGLRLQTMEGLYGDLGPANATGTSRPTGGAYASLDPGWGPDDTRVWITARSPYVQNCTTFGYGAVGQKIDGALHNGGNDSMVSNDFTQVISDGIGAWLLNNGRAEMVSVFTYYSHIGYLCETGGRARATNGNNSYGAFGSVAEGVDPNEIPVTAIVDNKFQYNATIGKVNTDQQGLMNFEFTHAGNDYTEVAFSVFGAGDNEEVVGDEFRDGAVIQSRVIDDVTPGDAGGSSYLLVSNTAQLGSSTSITIAATDGNIDTAYPGMKIVITGGAGIGQYALCDAYDSGTKIMTVIKESDGVAGWDHFVPGTTILSPNSSSTYQIEPAISFTAPAKSATGNAITSNQYNDLVYAETSEQFTAVTGTASGDGSGASFDVNRIGSKYYVTLNATGSNYVRLETITILGTSLGGATPANDLVVTLTTITSGAVVDFDFGGIAAKGKFVAVPNDTAGRYSVDGVTWTATTFPTAGSGVWTALASGLQNDGSSLFKQSAMIAICAGSSNVATSADGETWLAGTALPVAINSASGMDIAYGYTGVGINTFVVVSESDTDVAYTLDAGQNWSTSSSALPGTGFTAVTYGKGLFVAVQGGGSTVASTSEDGISWTTRTLPASRNWVDVVWGNGRFIAIADDNVAGAYSLDGIAWTAVTIGIASGLPKRIAYGQGMFAVSSTDLDGIAYSEYGVTPWAVQAVTSNTGGYDAIVFGNPDRNGKFVAIGTGTTTNTVSCILGATAKGRPSIASEKIFNVRLAEPGSTYASAPTMTVTDPNNIDDVVVQVRLGDGALGSPTIVAPGTAFATASAEVNAAASNGNADFFQDGSYLAVRRMTEQPVPGSNVTFDSLPDQYFKLVSTVSFLGTNDGSYTTFLQLSPAMSIADAPAQGDPVTMRIRFSQVRLTGHDFLDIGTGNFVDTNYPNDPVNLPVQAQETLDADGGRVFFTATDQDGNFRVGDLFSIEQATGVATLNADAFNIAGLQELTLGEVTLGGNSAAVSEFSTDPFFTANSDSVVPTQRAIKAYIEAQIGGGGATLNVNSITAGDIFISNNIITTASGELINITANINFTGSITGLPVAYNYFLR